MKVIGVETVHVAEFGNLVWARIHTDAGLVGLGETFRNPRATIAYVHETCAPALIGRDPLARSGLMRDLRERVGNHFSGYPTRSIEVRGNSAIDMALWDLAGQALGAPLYQLLGGKARERIRVYNTCASRDYNAVVRQSSNVRQETRGATPMPKIESGDDLMLQVHEPARLARELMAQGVSAMKIWPFDAAALANNGDAISAAELEAALWPVAEIRRELGKAMDIMIEFHGLWRLPAALKIARALADYGVFWLEEPISGHNPVDLAEYRRNAPAFVAAGENMGTLPWYKDVFMRSAVDVAHFDIAWVGGLSEGQRIAHLAEAFDRPIAPHDCTGPVTLANNVHLLAAAPNGLICETVRAYFSGFYDVLVTELPPIENGFIAPLTGPGVGTRLANDVFKRADVTVQLSGQRCG
jgi:L-alanine-DL-glutamate epimerase-like enolase superfamily enzyme